MSLLLLGGQPDHILTLFPTNSLPFPRPICSGQMLIHCAVKCSRLQVILKIQPLFCLQGPQQTPSKYHVIEIDHQIIFVRKFKCDFINPLNPLWMKGSTRNLMVMGGRGLHLESFQRTNGFFVWNIKWWCHWQKKINVNLKGGTISKILFLKKQKPIRDILRGGHLKVSKSQKHFPWNSIAQKTNEIFHKILP